MFSLIYAILTKIRRKRDVFQKIIKLNFSMYYYFISDLHLNESQPEITQQFLQFLQEKAPLAEAVYILGDFFDFWIGDDEQSPLINKIQQALKVLSHKKVKCYFICGNRDFLIGKAFAKKANITLLPDYYVVNLFDNSVLLCHGDTLCIDDISYQKFRKIAHNRFLQQLFLLLPLQLRMRIATKIRKKSDVGKQYKATETMDVNPNFTENMMLKHGTTHLIHGHTHKQAIHSCKFSQKSDRLFTRIVLGDWHKDKISILCWDDSGFRFEEDIKS